MSGHPATAQDLVSEEHSGYESWLSLMDALGVRFLVLDAEQDNELLQLAQTHPRWALDFFDGESVLYARVETVVETGVAA